jgi:hypothetical protein
MARAEGGENKVIHDVAALRDEVEILELQIRKIEGTAKLRRLRQERPERKAEREGKAKAGRGGESA